MVVRRALGMSSLAEAENRSVTSRLPPAAAGRKVWRSSTMETTENDHRKFELNALRYRQPTAVQCHEQWRYVLVLPSGVDQPSSGVQNRLKLRRQPSTQTSQCCIAIVKTCQDKLLYKRQQHRSSDRAFDTADLSESCKAA